MTDLIARLRLIKGVCDEAADRIEALQADQELSVQTMAQQYNTMLELRAEVDKLHSAMAGLQDMEAAAQSRITALEDALEYIDSENASEEVLRRALQALASGAAPQQAEPKEQP